ncbi:MAG: lactonase family protein, partial [Treponema sp.]|nr:lactonase family protein [Treponema sp.]
MAIYDIFIGTYTKGKDNGLFRCSFDNDSGEINLINTIDIESPSYLQLNNNILYGVSELSSFNGENGGALFAVYITAPEKMHLLDIKGTHGRHPCHLYIKDNYVFVSNYSEGSLSI